ncbi:MAG: hypothetical protein D6698_02060 [Gammaproteobacteria bacterium]|nr:MAG: hypothetical protein D6698_02060 [Gammaproteobacteria bacterium]
MVNPELRFLPNEAGEKEGLGDAGIETFRDSPYASCAREAGQNSRDAAKNKPVRMVFNVLELDHHNFPSRALLEDALEACFRGATEEREEEFFGNALEIIKREQIPVLEIADYNTKGLVGPPDLEGTPFHSLVKGSGVTAKDAVDAGGSFGIGKNASFAVSDLHTVFYSTIWEDPDNEGKCFAAQGKVKLVSHTARDGKKVRATGYWGNPEGFRAIVDRTAVPEWMNRTEVGTSIFSMGFGVAEDWAERMTFSLVTNFFCAVYREEMVFEVDDGKININRNTLENLLTRQDIVNAAEATGHKDDLVFAQQLYRCMVSDIAKEHVLNIQDLGRIRVRVLVEEGMPRRIGFVRRGMLITDNLRHFGHPFVRFPGSRDFVVLVEPEDTDASAFLKKLENPAHDGFSAERITDPRKRAHAARAMKQLGKELRNIIKQTTGVRHEGAVVLEELGRFFADQGQGERPPDPGTETDPERYIYKSQRKERMKPRPARDPNSGQEGGSSRTGKGSSGKGGGTGKGTGSGSEGHGTRGDRQPVALGDVRNLLRTDNAGAAISREIHFTPESDGLIEIRVEATGIDTPENLVVKSTSKGMVDSGAIIIEANARQRETVTITFDEPYEGPIELIAASRAESQETTA